MYPQAEFFKPGWSAETVAQMERFAQTHKDYLLECTRAARFPRDLYLEMGKRGWVGPVTPVEHGGLGGGVPEYCLIEEEVGRLGLVSPQISIQGQLWLALWGSDEQKQRYLKGIARGEIIFCEAISEPGVGSSLKSMRTTATRDGAHWVINGHKTHVNLGHQADVMIVYAMADEGLTSFLVDATEQGLSTRQTYPIGLRLIPTADIELDGVRVPDSALLGKPGEGLQTFLSTFNISRLGNASELIGFGRRALAEAITYAKDRQVGKEGKVVDFQGIQWIVANCYSELYAASLARDRAAMLAEGDQEHALETTLAKKLAIDAAEHAVNESFALIGGHGLYEDTPFRQILCDMKVLRVAGGSLEILRNYIARRVLRSEHYEGLA
jgi:alkylation response protein AidB-like acyl-CoA dehydrogenase